MQRCSTLLVIREHYIKAIMKYHLMVMVNIKKTGNTKGVMRMQSNWKSPTLGL